MSLRIFFVILFAIPSFSAMDAGYLFRDGKFYDENYFPSVSAEDHFEMGMEALEQGNIKEAIRNFKTVELYFAHLPMAQDVYYYVGLAYFTGRHYDLSNRAFTEYLTRNNQPKYYEEAQEYKLKIAEAFRSGAKMHLFGIEKLPRMLSGKTEAVKILDDLINVMPYHEIGARALYEQGNLLMGLRDYREGAEALHLLTRRFPNHDLAIESFVKLAELYLEQSKREFQNLDLLELAEINLQRFKQAYPNEKRVKNAEDLFEKMQETYAAGLCETGKYYERRGFPHASAIYYLRIVEFFPTTQASKFSQKKLESLRHLLPQEIQEKMKEHTA